MIKVTVLAENTAQNASFACEHGLCLHIETKQHKILFDSGQTTIFSNNAVLLGVDLSKVDIAVLSHGHYDHGGGLETFLGINPTAPLYINKNAFGKFYNGTEKNIGLSETLQSNRIVLTGDKLELDDELTLCTCNDKETVYPIDSAGLKVKTNNSFENDMFIHEHYLIINDSGRKIVVSGCSHKGVLNIMNWLKPDVFIGGFHFMKQKIDDNGNVVLDEAAKVLNSYSTIYYTCHCTGVDQYAYMKEKMNGKLHYLSSGNVKKI